MYMTFFSRNSWTNSGNRARSDRNRSDSNRPRYSPNRSRDYSPPPAKRSRHDTWDDAASPAMPQQTAPPLPLMQQQVDFMPGGPPHPHWQMQHDPMFHMSGGGGGGGGMYPNQFVPNNNSNSNSNVHMQSQQSRQLVSETCLHILPAFFLSLSNRSYPSFTTKLPETASSVFSVTGHAIYFFTNFLKHVCISVCGEGIGAKLLLNVCIYKYN